jgi:hypothetical protein
MCFMVSFEEMGQMLDEMATGFPQALYRELNGGISLVPESKVNPKGRRRDLYILGEYHNGGTLGRYILLYYGSFAQVFGHLDKEALAEELLHTLKHEFTHHLESLAGERDLEFEDAKFIAEYFNGWGRGNGPGGHPAK